MSVGFELTIRGFQDCRRVDLLLATGHCIAKSPRYLLRPQRPVEGMAASARRMYSNWPCINGDDSVQRRVGAK